MPVLKQEKSADAAATDEPAMVQVTTTHKLRRLLTGTVILLLAVFATLLISCPRCLQAGLSQTAYNLAFAFVMFVALWQANDKLAKVLDKYVLWFKNLGKRLLISLAGTVIVSSVVVLLVNLFFIFLRGTDLLQLIRQNWMSNFLGPVVITFFISLFLHSRSFLLGWRQTAINAERLQKENIASQYESLKAQVNPHFLFNSLNVLTSLVEADQKQAVKFIRQLSEVYRYVLDSHQKEVVPLQEELHFLESYIYLQKIRHGEALLLYNSLPQNNALLLVPLALQMLLENAIKHNMALEEEPLKIYLYIEQDYIVVKNNLQVRRTREESTGTGLTNIKARYGYLTSRPMLIQRTQEAFTVKLPILNFQP